MASIKGTDLIMLPISQGGGAASTDLVAAPNIALRIVVTAISFSISATTGSVKFTSGTTDITGAQTFVVNGGMAMIGDVTSPVLICAKGEKLAMTSTGSGANGWMIYYLSAT